MDIRKITTLDERVWSSLSNHLAFHGSRSMEDIRKAVEENSSGHDDWGCFTDDGRMMAHAQNERRLTMFDGHEVETGCIGAVSTFPEYREGGAVRGIFGKIFPDAYEHGEVFSYLYPFSHAFYRKFGYETCCELNIYRFPVSALAGRRFRGWARMWMPGDDYTVHAEIANRFNMRYNMTHVRTAENMKQRNGSDPFQSRFYTYLLGYGEDACAFVSLRDKRENDRCFIEVMDCAWIGKEGSDAVLGFIARYTADYPGGVIFRAPGDLKLSMLMSDGYSLAGSELANGYMARVINVQKALSLLRKPEGAEFTIAVSDPMIPENDGVWHVCGDSAEKCSADADISVSVTALAPMLLGAMPLPLAKFRDDVKVNANRDILEKVFVEKPAYVAPVDHF